MKQTICAQCRKKLRVAWDSGYPECAHCRQSLREPGSRLQIEVDEAAAAAAAQAEHREQQASQRNELAVRRAALGLLLGANGAALIALLLQVSISNTLLLEIGAGLVIGVAYWLLADLFEPSAADMAGGTRVGDVQVVTDLHMLALPFVMGSLLRAVFGNLHAGLMFPLLGMLIGVLTIAGFRGGPGAALPLLAAVLGGVLGGVLTFLLSSTMDSRKENEIPKP